MVEGKRQMDRDTDAIKQCLMLVIRSTGFVKMVVRRFVMKTKILQRFARRLVCARTALVTATLDSIAVEESLMPSGELLRMWETAGGVTTREGRLLAVHLVYQQQRRAFRQQYRHWSRQAQNASDRLNYQMHREAQDLERNNATARSDRYQLVTPLRQKLVAIRSARPRFVMELSARQLAAECTAQTQRALVNAVLDTIRRLGIEVTDPKVLSTLLMRYERKMKETREWAGREDMQHGAGREDMQDAFDAEVKEVMSVDPFSIKQERLAATRRETTRFDKLALTGYVGRGSVHEHVTPAEQDSITLFGVSKLSTKEAEPEVAPTPTPPPPPLTASPTPEPPLRYSAANEEHTARMLRQEEEEGEQRAKVRTFTSLPLTPQRYRLRTHEEKVTISHSKARREQRSERQRADSGAVHFTSQTLSSSGRVRERPSARTPTPAPGRPDIKPTKIFAFGTEGEERILGDTEFARRLFHTPVRMLKRPSTRAKGKTRKRNEPPSKYSRYRFQIKQKAGIQYCSSVEAAVRERGFERHTVRDDASVSHTSEEQEQEWSGDEAVDTVSSSAPPSSVQMQAHHAAPRPLHAHRAYQSLPVSPSFNTILSPRSLHQGGMLHKNQQRKHLAHQAIHTGPPHSIVYLSKKKRRDRRQRDEHTTSAPCHNEAPPCVSVLPPPESSDKTHQEDDAEHETEKPAVTPTVAPLPKATPWPVDFGDVDELSETMNDRYLCHKLVEGESLAEQLDDVNFMGLVERTISRGKAARNARVLVMPADVGSGQRAKHSKLTEVVDTEGSKSLEHTVALTLTHYSRKAFNDGAGWSTKPVPRPPKGGRLSGKGFSTPRRPVVKTPHGASYHYHQFYAVEEGVGRNADVS